MEEKRLCKDNVALSNRMLEQDRLILNDNNRVAELRVHFQLEQDRLVQTHDICTAELISDLHKMTLKCRKERGMFDVVRKSKDAVIVNLKIEHSDEIIKIKKEDDTIRYNLEKENTIIKAFPHGTGKQMVFLAVVLGAASCAQWAVAP